MRVVLQLHKLTLGFRHNYERSVLLQGFTFAVNFGVKGEITTHHAVDSIVIVRFCPHFLCHGNHKPPLYSNMLLITVIKIFTLFRKSCGFHGLTWEVPGMATATELVTSCPETLMLINSLFLCRIMDSLIKEDH